MTPADGAWLTLAGGVIVWDLRCPDGETLSEGVGRYHGRRPWLTRFVIAVVVLHLLDWLPDAVDPIHAVTRLRHR